MSKYLTKRPLADFSLWEKIEKNRGLSSFTLEITARCNNNCRHCYINLPASDPVAITRELTLGEINRIADDAVSLGAVWCLLSGGEPLLRKDFIEIYLALIRKGLLVSVFTNANLITKEHIQLFKKHHPRDIEVSVYGVSRTIYEQVTRVPGSFRTFQRGLNVLLENDINVRLKAVALRSNKKEFIGISDFCRKHTKDFFRFDPFLNLRYDRDNNRNKEILNERLSDEEIVELEKSDAERFKSLKRLCQSFASGDQGFSTEVPLIGCGAGVDSCTIGYDGTYHLCSSLQFPDFCYDLRKGSLHDAWLRFTPDIRARKIVISPNKKTCSACGLVNLCMACPANNYIEFGKLDGPVQHFCSLAEQRASMLKLKEMLLSNDNTLKKGDEP